MANPNLLNILSAFGKTDAFTITSIPSLVVSNPAASNKVYKINSIFIANTQGVLPATITLSLFRNNTAYPIASTVKIEQDSSLVALGKDTGLYLEEGDSLQCTASEDGFLTGVVSYEILG